jgi:aspartate-semialdehyde dehydrogenase
MKRKIPVGILGATGMVGQNYLLLLQDHPLFEVTFLAASERSANRSYESAVSGRWRMAEPIPETAGPLEVHTIGDESAPFRECALLFSAFNADMEETRRIERRYAAAGVPLVSNNSAHRLVDSVPILMPEVNPGHLAVIGDQRKREGWDRGFIVTKPNCGIQSYVLPVHALRSAGYAIREIITTNLQALSGAGYPGQSALDVIDNMVPLPSEEEKSFTEPQKIFGTLRDGRIIPEDNLRISSSCLRVPVVHGHTSCVWFAVEGDQPSLEDLETALRQFRGEPQERGLPSAPQPVLRFSRDRTRPQPRLDRDRGKGMAVTVGGLQKSPVLGYRFTALSHNTVRGAAGGAILTAELLEAKGFLDSGK